MSHFTLFYTDITFSVWAMFRVCEMMALCIRLLLLLEIVFTRAAPAFDNLFMGCVFNINTVHKTVEKLTFQAFY